MTERFFGRSPKYFFMTISMGVFALRRYKELGKIDKDVYRIAESKIGIEPELLDKPLASEE